MFSVAKTTWNSRIIYLFIFFYLNIIFLSKSKVAQRDIPGIDGSYLAMDTEEGVEVVWNEVLFSERKISDIQHVWENQIYFSIKIKTNFCF